MNISSQKWENSKCKDLFSSSRNFSIAENSEYENVFLKIYIALRDLFTYFKYIHVYLLAWRDDALRMRDWFQHISMMLKALV